jgi:GNAT superfamily N-acetyltransferase
MYVRRAGPADIPVLLPLCRQFHAESPHHSPLPFSDARVLELLEATIASSAWLAIVACDDDGAIVGMALFYVLHAFFSDAIECGDLTLWVAPEHRGGRAAWKLLSEVRKWAVKQGAARLQIGVTTGINTDQVVRFLGKAGFANRGPLMVLQPVN